MLSAAHVLAMDAKNLLDVVDSIRKKYPNLSTSTDSDDIKDGDNVSHAKNSDITPKLMGKLSTINLNDENIERKTKTCDVQPTSNQEEIYVNQLPKSGKIRKCLI